MYIQVYSYSLLWKRNSGKKSFQIKNSNKYIFLLLHYNSLRVVVTGLVVVAYACYYVPISLQTFKKWCASRVFHCFFTKLCIWRKYFYATLTTLTFSVKLSLLLSLETGRVEIINRWQAINYNFTTRYR